VQELIQRGLRELRMMKVCGALYFGVDVDGCGCGCGCWKMGET